MPSYFCSVALFCKPKLAFSHLHKPKLCIGSNEINIVGQVCLYSALNNFYASMFRIAAITYHC